MQILGLADIGTLLLTSMCFETCIVWCIHTTQLCRRVQRQRHCIKAKWKGSCNMADLAT